MPSLRPLAMIPVAIFVYFIVHLDLHVQLVKAFSQHDNARDMIPFSAEGERFHYLNDNTPKTYSRHIVAVGDLHGDYPSASKVLQFSGVTDENDDWAGGVDFFVQTGDIIDRGDDTTLLFKLMDKLREQAPQKGGTVLSHLGNHEWMNVIGDWRYVYPSEIKTFGTVENRQEILSTGWLGRSWAANYTTASRLPLHPSLGPPNTPYPPSSPGTFGSLSHSAISFVHGGLSPTYHGLSPFPSYINSLSDSLMRKLQFRVQPKPHPPSPYLGLPAGTTHEEAELYSSNGPLWYRGWATGTEEQVCNDVEAVLEKTGTRRMIMGHTPDFENIKSRCGGKIIIIDTGISRAYGGALSALSIHYTLEPIGTADDPEKQQWEEREIVEALYADRKELISNDRREIAGDFHLR